MSLIISSSYNAIQAIPENLSEREAKKGVWHKLP
jgi:hypothetical protein